MTSFLTNKYTQWYNAIITHRKIYPLDGYVEKHHIVPRSMGGSDDVENIVKLSAREHFVCHRLLAKMTTGGSRRSMSLALHVMAYGTNRDKYVVSSRIYEHIRKLDADAIRELQLRRFKTDNVAYERQVEICSENSKLRVEQLKTDPAAWKQASETSKRVQAKRIAEGYHNFTGGAMQRAVQKRPEVKAKRHINTLRQISQGIHVFQQPEFIEQQRAKIKAHWKNMTPDERAERGRRISEGRRKKKVT